MDWNFKGQSIRVIESGRFVIDWTDDLKTDGSDFHFMTKDEAEKAINETLVIKAKAMTLSILVLLPNGSQATITGINRNTSRVILDLSENFESRHRINEVYPDAPGMIDLLSKIAGLESQLTILKKPLADLRINCQIGSGRIDVEQYHDRIATLKNRVSQAYEKAQGMNQS